MPEELLTSDRILSQLDSQAAAAPVLLSDEKANFLIFRLADQLLAFPGKQAREILPFTAITWIPGATALLPGVMNVRGDVAAVLDARQLLGLPASEPQAGTAFLIMMQAGDGRTGLLADTIIDVAEVPVAETVQSLPTLDERFRRFALSQFVYEQQLVTVLDATALIDSAVG